MALTVSRVTVGTSAVRLDSALQGAAFTAAEHGAFRINRSASVVNRGAASVFLGPPGVTVDNGYELAAGEPLGVDLAPDDTLYAISAGSVRVDVLQNVR